MLSKNIPEMGKANMTTLLTGSGIGIKLHNPNAQIAEELQNLRLLKQDIENPNTPDINKKSSMLKSSKILDTIENFVTGKGRLDNAFIEKAFRTPENIEKNKTVFQHYRKQIENAKTMDDFEEAVQELDAYVYKIQSQQGSTKRKHLITLMNGANMKDSSAYFNILTFISSIISFSHIAASSLVPILESKLNLLPSSHTTKELATSPALCPPIPSATTNKYSPDKFLTMVTESSLWLLTFPGSV